ncbi:MAG: 4-(cytidine 5'-diphospho)-2-C-methyl-D-erythritol kinase [Bacteroidota bacterium]
MIRFPNCKINIGLNIVSKRSDGYHDIESIFIPVNWCDVLEIIPASDSIPRLFLSGIELDGETEDNLCFKAFRLLEKSVHIPPVHIHLLKNIPSGAGLGGGSSDGAFTLLMLDELFGLGIGTAELKNIALQLGSDCPFFIDNIPALATGRGDILSPITISLRGLHIVIIKPPVHVSTALAYSKVVLGKTFASLASAITKPIPEWRNNIVNDFESPVFAAHPILASIKEDLYRQGALYASMSGSGSAVYGIFKEKPGPEIGFPGCTSWQAPL